MKKVSLLAILATVASVPAAMAQAQVASPACPKAFQGFGIKGNIGYGVGKGNQKVTSDQQFETLRNSLGVNGVDGGIGVDYTHRFCNWALGIAFDANWANTSGRLKVDNDEFTAKASLRNSLQLYGRAGYVLANMVMPFVGLGWDNSQWSQRATVDDTAVAGNRGRGRSHSKRVNGLLWKAGVDFLATRHVVVGLEYTGVSSGKIKSHFNGRDRSGDALRTASSFKPQNNSFALTAKLVY